MRAQIMSLSVLATVSLAAHATDRPLYLDKPFRQDVSIRFRNDIDPAAYELRTVRADRDGKVLVNTDKGLLWTCENRLTVFNQYAALVDCDHRDLELLEGKFVFLTDKMFLPLHGAGIDYRHNAGGEILRAAAASPGHYLQLTKDKLIEIRDGKTTETSNVGFDEIRHVSGSGRFLLLAPDRIGIFANGTVQTSPKFAAAVRGAVAINENEIAVATAKGLYVLEAGKTIRKHAAKLPVEDLTCIDRVQAGRLWIGSVHGAFSLDADNHVNYYAGRRWIHDNHVLDVHADPKDDIYVLTKTGLAKIVFKQMTLADKADHYQKRLRHRFIRYGFVSDVSIPGEDPANTRLHDSDNDGLWTGMYLAAEAFRYGATRSENALRNALDAFDALERQESINPLGGFQARTFELHGYKVSDPDRWRERPEKDWDWKGHTSSDELCGTFFAHAVLHETVGKDRPDVAARTAVLVGKIMDHVVDHDFYLVDVDGKPTRWGRWNPDYVNTERVRGDRRLNSVEILSFLQLAYKLTGREKFKKAFHHLIDDHGYAENTVNYLPNPMGFWNHSDDELYWLAYYNLLKHTFDDKYRAYFLRSIDAHHKATLRKKNPVWNQIYAAVTDRPVDLDGPIFILREFPLDLRRWHMANSHRKDIEISLRGFGRWTVRESVTVLPPDERSIHKWNGNEMRLDGGGGGTSAESGAEFLLPYWMGRYFGFISPPQKP